MTIGPRWPRIFMDGQGRKVTATVRGGSVFGGAQPVSRACGKGEGFTLDGCPVSLRGFAHAPMRMRRLGQSVRSSRVQ
ncbi:hypothetical protein CAK78_16355 [Aeromonas sp. A35_P]|nr:hypothetical protein CAK78_16355 [Aeromonas sp. A35_P]